MDEPAITIVIEGRTYRLRAGHGEAISAVPSADRRHLIALLEAVKARDEMAEQAIREVVDKAAGTGRATAVGATGAAPLGAEVLKSGRLGRGDIDNLMARLALEERQSRNPIPTRQGAYKWIAGVTALVVLLALVF